jgi:hypothetical protein
MERPNLPFPLAVNSSSHSHYHRFLLGADPAVLAPFPKPYCIGELGTPLARLAGSLDLQRWRKLYHGSFPWVAGFGGQHYDLGNVPAHRPLPREYARPVRKFGAFDFVHAADPSVSALALVAGDSRVLARFMALSDDFSRRIEEGAASRSPGPTGSRATARMLAGQFAEPNNRWLMPYLHVHARVLNFTGFREEPGRLDCIDPAALARAAQRAKLQWVGRQAEALSDLGYRVGVCEGPAPALRVEGVCGRLLAAIEAPRIAVMRILEKILVGDRPPSVERLAAELPAPVIAAMAEELESALARSHFLHRPAKVAIPSEGPWRGSVREHLGHYCPGSLDQLDAAALRARAVPCESCIFPTPPLDPAHCHAPAAECLEARSQLPRDPDLGVPAAPGVPGLAAPAFLAAEFEETLMEVNERIVRAGPSDPLVCLRGMLARIDHLSEGADASQLRKSRALLAAELEARAPERAPAPLRERAPLDSLDDLFEDASLARAACEQEIGGRSL